MLEEEKNTSEPVETKTENKEEKKEELTKTQVINLEKIKCPDIEIEKEKKDVNIGELVEGKRKEIFDKYKANRKFNNIIMVVVVALVVMAFVFIVQENQAMKISGFIIAGVVLVALICYYAFTRNKFPNATKAYIKDVAIDMNKHVFNDDRFKDMITNEQTKIEMTEIVADRVYLSPTDIGSRNVCEGHFNKTKFKVAELALYRQVSRKQRDVCFVGKYISLENNMKFDGRAILTIKGEKNLDLPSDIEDLKITEEDSNYQVLSEESFKLSSILSSKAISALKKIKVKGNLLNVNIVFWGGHTAVYLSYDDPVISLPFDKPFQPEALEQYISDLKEVLSILTEM